MARIRRRFASPGGRGTALVAAVALAAAMSACTALPVSSPPAPFDVSVPDSDPIELSADGPTADSDPLSLVADFLLACAAGPNDDFATARLFLSAPSAQTWEPDEQILIYDTASTPVIDVSDEGTDTATTVLVTAPAVASVDSSGILTASPNSQIDASFSLVKENGQWRIDAPDNAFIVSRASFAASYQLANLYFPSTLGDALIADPRWYPSRRLTGHLLEGLVNGPRESLEGTVTNAIPGGTSIPSQGIETSERVAKVELNAALGEDPRASRLLAWEIVKTLTQDPAVSTVELTVSGQKLPTDDPPHDPSYSIDTRIALEDESIGIMEGLKVMPLAVRASPSARAQDAAVSPISRELVAWRDGDDLIAATIGSDGALGSVSVGDVGAPSIDRFGWVWSASKDPQSPIIILSVTGESVPVAVMGEPLDTAARVAISPDGARALVVKGSGDSASAMLFSIERNDAGVPLSLTHGETIAGLESGVIDVSWVASTSFIAAHTVESEAAGAVSLASITLGGLSTSSPAPTGTVSVTAGASTSSVCVRTAAGTVQCRSGALWQMLPKGIRDLHFAG